MMRSPSCWAVAVRTPSGTIAEVVRDVKSPQRKRLWRLPVLRGVVALGESLAIGFRALAISANYAAQLPPAEGDDDADRPAEPVQTEIPKGAIIASFTIAIVFALSLFKVGPAVLTNLLPIEQAGWFVIVEGLIRVAVLVAYVGLIGLVPDLRRVFQYHGAEHKAINALEDGAELEPEVVQKYSLIHPRCGTAFLLYVMVIGIFVFALVGKPAWYWLILSRILLLPVIAGLAYEVIRFAGKHRRNAFLMALLAPGLWLQRLTTREPTLDQVEVAIRSLREVRERELAQGHDPRVEVMA
ncbi:MAG: DUF1385 domain-containing protein [Actinobacteria bacterium]|nr:DUF1385 domain-containing protein [Actinomycetota bacterium]